MKKLFLKLRKNYGSFVTHYYQYEDTIYSVTTEDNYFRNDIKSITNLVNKLTMFTVMFQDGERYKKTFTSLRFDPKETETRKMLCDFRDMYTYDFKYGNGVIINNKIQVQYEKDLTKEFFTKLNRHQILEVYNLSYNRKVFKVRHFISMEKKIEFEKELERRHIVNFIKETSTKCKFVNTIHYYDNPIIFVVEDDYNTKYVCCDEQKIAIKGTQKELKEIDF